MVRILVVDDEPRCLETLESTLKRQKQRWESVFVEGGEQALEYLRRQTFAVVVCDLRMPRVDGMVVLEAARIAQPQAVRILMAAPGDALGSLKAVSLAHQFLAKPIDPSAVEQTLERACEIHALIREPELRRILGQIQKLPALPSTWARLQAAIDSPTGNASMVAAVLKADVAICARILQLVNSPFFGPVRRITALEDAVTYLGNNLIKNLVFSLELFQATDQEHLAFTLAELRSHTLLTATIARRLVLETPGVDRKLGDDAFFAGMLHDVGLLVLASLPKEAEADTGLHAQLGAYLLSLWGMAPPLIHAALDHHEPGLRASGRFNATTAVHVADALVLKLIPFSGCGKAELDTDYLDLVGVEDQVGRWEKIAEEATAAMGALGGVI
jgi:HD-like signal output (HDOD) protein/CheY-like chemotaxis protein